MQVLQGVKKWMCSHCLEEASTLVGRIHAGEKEPGSAHQATLNKETSQLYFD